jgi:hypothetical protein
MPIRTPQPIPYSSPIFYGEGELSYNEQREQLCDFFGSPMCLPWDEDEPFCFQFKAGETGGNLLTCLPIKTGTATGGSATTLVDTGGDFIVNGIVVGMLVRNTVTGDTFAVNTGGVAATTLTLVGTPTLPDAFSAGQGYAIYAHVLNTLADIGSISILTDHSICFAGFDGQLNLSFPALNFANRYRSTINLCSYTQGRIEIVSSLGLTFDSISIESPGTFDWYFRQPSFNYLQIASTSTVPFTGCLCLCQSEAFRMRQTYAYSINGGEWTEFTYSGSAINKGIIEKCIELPEGCDNTVCLSDDYQCAVYQKIGEVGNWNTDVAAGVSVDGSNVCFDGAEKDLFAYAEAIGCDINQQVTNIQFELTISAHSSGNVQVCIQNTDLSGEVCSNPFGSNGVHLFTVSNFGMPAGQKRIIIKAHNNNATLCATLRYRIQGFEPNVFACSECYNVKPINCEMKLEWDNDTNAFGHVYTTGYTNTMYLDGRLLNGKITSIAHEERKGVDSYQRSFFSNGRKVEELAIDAVWPAVHQSVAVGLMHRNFYINGVQYVKIGEYEPDYSADAEIAPCTVEVAKRDQRFIVNPL